MSQKWIATALVCLMLSGAASALAIVAGTAAGKLSKLHPAPGPVPTRPEG